MNHARDPILKGLSDDEIDAFVERLQRGDHILSSEQLRQLMGELDEIAREAQSSAETLRRKAEAAKAKSIEYARLRAEWQSSEARLKENGLNPAIVTVEEVIEMGLVPRIENAAAVTAARDHTPEANQEDDHRGG